MTKRFSQQTRIGVSAFLIGLLTWLSALGWLVSGKQTDYAQQAERVASSSSATAQAAMSHLPVSFEENRGQVDRTVRFIARQQGYALYLSETKAHFELRGPASQRQSFSMRLAGASPNAKAKGQQPLPGKSNYFIGDDPQNWQTNIPTFASVRQQGVYPGIDVVFYGNAQQLEYDFVVAPQADPQQIELVFDEVEKLELNEHGDLMIGIGETTLAMLKPVVYQELNGSRRPIESGYTIRNQTVGFVIGDYDPDLPLVIDPVIDYSTYFGGSGTDIGYGIAVDRNRNVYITGQTSSLNFPTKNPVQNVRDGANDAFVTKLSADGSMVLFSTYLGGRNSGDRASALAVDKAGNVYVTGETNSLNFPLVNPAQSIYRGNVDAFVVKLSIDGNVLLYSTTWGGTLQDVAYGIALDRFDNAYITGRTDSTNFPTKNPMQASLKGVRDVFVSKFSPDGASIYSTYLGGDLSPTVGRDEEAGYSIAVDAMANAYITGFTTSPGFPVVGAVQPSFAGVEDAFVTKLNAAGSELVYSTFLGGDRAEEARAIAVDSLGNAYVTGYTFSLNFPTANALQRNYGGSVDAFVAKYNATGSALIYSTFLGGNGSENTGLIADITPVGGIAVDNFGNAYVTGKTESSNFPVTRAIQSALRGDNDAFVAKIDPAGFELVYSTYLGSTFTGDNGFDERGLDIAIDQFGSAYVTGQVLKNDFPTMLPVQPNFGGGLSDAFITKISTPDIPTIFMVSAASFTGGSLAAEEIVTAFGANLASGVEIGTTTPLPTTLLGTSIKVKDKNNVERPAPLFFVSPTQINFQLPPETAAGKAVVTVTNAQNTSISATVLIEKTAPGIFTANASGQEAPAAVLLRVKQDGTQIYEPVAQFNGQLNKYVPLPIDFGAESDQLFLLLFGSGWRGHSGSVIALIGGTSIPIQYAGPQGDFIGQDQINLQLPRTLIGRGEATLSLTVDGQMANLVTVAFR